VKRIVTMLAIVLNKKIVVRGVVLAPDRAVFGAEFVGYVRVVNHCAYEKGRDNAERKSYDDNKVIDEFFHVSILSWEMERHITVMRRMA
jgi:hypothetical protein